MGHTAFRKALVISSVIMLSGIVMLIAGEAFLIHTPWRTRAATLLIVSGAFVELLTIWRFTKSR